MTAALLYRPAQRWQIWVAFACATVLYFVAICLARSVPEIASFPRSTDGGVVVAIDPPTDQTPIQPVEPTPSEFVKSDETFPDENSTPAPIAAAKRKAVSPSVKSVSTAGVSGPSSVKVLAVYAPRPDYPYEARRQRTTGSGLVVLTIDSSTGSVTEARMAQSTGSDILDHSAVSALRRWRFRPGTITRAQVPITFTFSGASY